MARLSVVKFQSLAPPPPLELLLKSLTCPHPRIRRARESAAPYRGPPIDGFHHVLPPPPASPGDNRPRARGVTMPEKSFLRSPVPFSTSGSIPRRGGRTYLGPVTSVSHDDFPVAIYLTRRYDSMTGNGNLPRLSPAERLDSAVMGCERRQKRLTATSHAVLPVPGSPTTLCSMRSL